MPLLNYKCPACGSERELFDDESKKCRKTECSGVLEAVVEGNVTTAGTTNLYENRHTYYDSTGTKTEWNNKDMQRLEMEKAAKAFQIGLKKL